MKRILWMILVIALLATAAQAQQGATITLTETQLNQAVNLRLSQIDTQTPLGSIQTMSVDLQDMKVVLSGKLKQPNSEVWNYKITLRPSVDNQQQKWIVEEAILHTIKSPRDSASGQATGLIDVWEHAYSAALASTAPGSVNLPVLSITISQTPGSSSGIIAILIG